MFAAVKRKSVFVIPKKMKDVQQIPETQGVSLKTESEIRNYIEYPLVKAMVVLVERNIPTYFSSANCSNNYSSEAYIIIEYHGLSEENKLIANNFAQINNDCANLIVPFNENTDVEVVSKAMLALANQFKWQRLRGVEKLTPADFVKAHLIGEDDLANKDELEVIKFLEKELGVYYSKEEKLFYWSVDDYIKANYRPIEE